MGSQPFELTSAEDSFLTALAERFALLIEAAFPRLEVRTVDLELGLYDLPATRPAGAERLQ